MRMILVAGVLIVGPGPVAAQPGQTQPDPAMAQPQPVQQPYSQQPPHAPKTLMISSDDQEILERGEISDLEYIGGGAGSLFFGFGFGQAVQGRWDDTGWI